MQYAVELFFNKEVEEKINRLVTRIADEQISTKYLEWNTRPHLTLACYNNVDEEKCIKYLKEFAKSHHKLLAGLGSVGMFVDTKTIFLAPIMTSGLYQFQRDLHNALGEFDTKGYEWYVTDRWAPHCTVALCREDEEDAFFKASILVLREFEKLIGEFSSIGLVKISFPVEEICTIDLK